MSYLIGLDPAKRRQALKFAITRLRGKIRELGVEFIAVRGASGLLMGPSIGEKFKLQVVYIRKDHERSHGIAVERQAECNGKKYLIVDDIICSGDTVKIIQDSLKSFSAVCVGVYLYHPNHDADGAWWVDPK